MIRTLSVHRFGGSGAANRLILGDNLHVLGPQDENSVDMVYIDPPFATGERRRGREPKAPNPAKRALGYADPLRHPCRYVEWLAPRLVALHFVLKPTGSLFVHLDQRTVHYVKVFLDRLFGRSRFINEIIWCYSVGGKSRRAFGKKHDTLLWYSKTSNYAFFPDAVRMPRKTKSHMRVVFDEEGNQIQEKTHRQTGKIYRYPVHQGKVPEDWWTDIETLNRSDAQRTGWPTQKPEKLIERLILSTTQPKDLILDTFTGSGTTPAVAQALGRRFIAVDRHPRALSIASHRLLSAAQALAVASSPPADLHIEKVEQQKCDTAPLCSFSPADC